MRDPSAFFRWVMPWATTCPEPLAETHIVEAAREFCRATRCWRHLDTMHVDDCRNELVCVPNHSILYEIETARFNGQRLERVSLDRAWLDDDDYAQPTQITQVGPMSIRLAPGGGSGTLSLSMFLIPDVDAAELPDLLYEQHAQAIGHGALAAILTLPDQAYTNPQMAEYNRGLFQQAMDCNFATNVRGQQRAPLRSRSRFF
jgi:hypothetical protein